MDRRFDSKRRTGKRNFIFFILIAGLTFSALFASLFRLQKMQEQFNKSFNNIDIAFFDHSIQKINPSGKLLIDGQIVFQFDSISNSLHQECEIKLDTGTHLVEVSTLDNQYYLLDSIELMKYPIKYKLEINFYYKPPLDEYRMSVIDYFYKRDIKGKDYTEEQKSNVLEQLTEIINLEFESETNYKSTNPYFTISFQEKKPLKIE